LKPWKLLINTYWVCGMLTDEKAKKAKVVCETMKKP
jgi:hypothetical protein